MFLKTTKPKLGNWSEPDAHRLHLEGKPSQMTFPAVRHKVSNGRSAPPLGRPFESLPTIAKSTGTAMFLRATKKTKAKVAFPKEQLQVTPEEGKKSLDTPSVSRLESRVSNGAYGTAWKTV
jgi:hypothetical protein